MGRLTSNGYEIKTQNEFFEEEKALYKDIDANWNLDPSTPDGLKIAHDAEVFGALDQLIKQAYDARDPNKACGYDLDVLRALTGAKRSLGTPSTVALKVTGEPGTVIFRGAKVKTSDEKVFAVDENVVIGLDGTATVGASCTANGVVEVSANSLTTIVDTVGGWQTVTNPAPASPGTDRDSDAVFRLKSAKSVGRAGQNQKESLFGELYDTYGVRRVAIYENKTNSATVDALHNPHGLPAHSLAIVVDGGSDEDVAESIYLKLCPGVALHAAGTKVDRQVYSKAFPSSYDVITFSRPVAVPIKIEMTVVDPLNLFGSQKDLQERMAQAYVNYFDGDLLPSGVGFKTTGFDIGESVPYSRLFTPVNQLLGDYSGTYVRELKVNGGTANVEIAFNQLARFSVSDVTVQVVAK